MSAVLCLLFLLLLLCFPKLCVCGAADGLALWLFTLVPTFFPFLFLSNLMVSCGAAENVSRLCARLFCPLFRVSAPGAYVLFMGFLCGYPMGAKLTAEFVQTGRISREEGSCLLTFCNNPSPMFLAGFVLSDCMKEPYSMPAALAMFYGAPVLTGLLFSRVPSLAGLPGSVRPILRDNHHISADAQSTENSRRPADAQTLTDPHRPADPRTSIDFHRPTNPRTSTDSHRPADPRTSTDSHRSADPRFPAACGQAAQAPSLMSRIRSSMSDAFATLLDLGGYVILFHIGSALILALSGHFSQNTYPFFCLLAASLEMSGGAAYLAASGLPARFINLFVPLCVISGGICIAAQTAGLLSGNGLSVKAYVKGKLVQIAIAAAVYLLAMSF